MRLSIPILLVYAAVCLVLSLVQCTSQSDLKPHAAAGKNVLLISMDTTRIDYLEPYGGGRVKTPTLKTLAADGIVFVDVVTPAPLTVPAHASLLTGLHPVRHSVQDNFKSILPDEATTIAELFAEAGYQTAGVIGAVLLSRRGGFHQGFEYFDDRFQVFEFQAVQPTVERSAGTVSAKAVGWLDQYAQSNSGKPFFLFAHYYDPHMIYNPPEPFLSQYPKSPYSGEIAYTDQQIGVVIDALKRHQLYDETLIMVVGDHGEGLKNHQEQTHGLFLYEEVIRVPLIVKPPASLNLPNDLYVTQSASLLDVVPTLVDFCGLGFSDNDGMSLVSWLVEGTKKQERFTIHDTQYPLTYNWSPLAAIRSQQWKFVLAPNPELYNLQTDPKEQYNLVDKEPQKAAELQTELEERLFSMIELGTLDAVQQPSSAQTEVLTSLGYVSGGTADAGDETLPDPKDKIEVYELIDNGLGALSRGNVNKAVELFQQAAQMDPKNPNPQFNLAMAYSRMGKWQQAVETMQLAISMTDDHIYMNLQLARIYASSGDYEKAETLLMQLTDKRPSFADAHFQLGWIELQRKNYLKALEHLKNAQTWMPDMPGLDIAIQEAKQYIK